MMRFFWGKKSKGNVSLRAESLLPGRSDKKRFRNKEKMIIGAIIFCAVSVVAFLIFAWVALSNTWNDQCRVEDPDVDIIVSAGKMVKPEVITSFFGLTNGVNLATIDFRKKRLDILKKVPNIHNMTITRRLPNRITIDVTEREPIARLVVGNRGLVNGNRLVDKEGIVFEFARGLNVLPIIRESPGDDPAATVGDNLDGRAATALRFLIEAGNTWLDNIRVTEIDLSHKDYLYLTLATYQHVKFAWDGMDEDSQPSREALRKQLENFATAFNSRIGDSKTIWNATDSSRVFASNSIGDDR